MMSVLFTQFNDSRGFINHWPLTVLVHVDKLQAPPKIVIADSDGGIWRCRLCDRALKTGADTSAGGGAR